MATLLQELIHDYGDDPVKVTALVMAMGDKAVAHLIPSLNDPLPNHRMIAAQLLGQIGDTSAVPALIAALPVNGLNTEVEYNKCKAHYEEHRDRLPSPLGLGANKKLRREIYLLASQIHHAFIADVQCSIMRALANIGDKRAIKPLMPYCNAENPTVRETANIALRLLQTPELHSNQQDIQ